MDKIKAASLSSWGRFRDEVTAVYGEPSMIIRLYPDSVPCACAIFYDEHDFALIHGATVEYRDIVLIHKHQFTMSGVIEVVIELRDGTQQRMSFPVAQQDEANAAFRKVSGAYNKFNR